MFKPSFACAVSSRLPPATVGHFTYHRRSHRDIGKTELAGGPCSQPTAAKSRLLDRLLPRVDDSEQSNRFRQPIPAVHTKQESLLSGLDLAVAWDLQLRWGGRRP